MSALGAVPRFVVVNADDLGIARATTLAIVQAHRRGVVTSASLVTTTAAYDHALHELAGLGGTLGIGLHFTLSVGRPVSPVGRVPLLVDSSGYLRWTFLSLWRALMTPRRAALLEQIEIELAAQLTRALRDGLAIDHIDGERHIHLLPGILGCALGIARRHNIRHVRLLRDIGPRYLELRTIHEVLTNGGILKYVVLRLLTHLGARTARQQGFPSGHYATVLYTGRMHRILEQVLRRPPPGFTEVAVHPGLPRSVEDENIGNRAVLAYLRSPDREHELNACLNVDRSAIGARLVRFADLAR